MQAAISALPGLSGAVTVTKTSGGNFRIAITGRHSAQVLTASTTSAGAAIRNYDSLNPNADYGTHAVQAALDAAAGRPNATGPGQHGPEVLVVVYPNTDSSDPYNPESAYYENLIMHSPAKLQGVGPGGAYADGTDVAGTVIDGSAYQADAQSGTDWFALANSLAFDGNQNIYEGETLMVVANDGGAGQGTTRVDQFRSNFAASIDGLKIMGGRHDGFPNNRDPVTGAPNGQTATVETQGGGIYVNAQAHSLQITNDVIQGNSGAYGGGIRLGTPNIGSNQNDNVRIAFNRIDQNGGTNLAGGVGIFAGATNYRIDHNTLCGNNSAEYGGAISHFGLSSGGKIDHNRIWFNRSYDEGGAVFVGSELPANPNTMPVGAGAGRHHREHAAGECRQRRRRRSQAADGRRPASQPDRRRRAGHHPAVRRPRQHPQQHDREQRLDPRGRRNRARRLDQRRGRQQHGRPQHHDRHGDDEHRRAGARRALDGRQQLPAAGRAGQALRRRTPGRCSPSRRSSTTRSPTTARARGRSRRASTASARTETQARSTSGTSASPTTSATGRATPAAASRRSTTGSTPRRTTPPT